MTRPGPSLPGGLVRPQTLCRWQAGKSNSNFSLAFMLWLLWLLVIADFMRASRWAFRKTNKREYTVSKDNKGGKISTAYQAVSGTTPCATHYKWLMVNVSLNVSLKTTKNTENKIFILFSSKCPLSSRDINEWRYEVIPRKQRRKKNCECTTGQELLLCG